MTTLQKTIIGTVLAAAVGTGVYEAHRAARLQSRLRALERERTEQAEQFRRAQDKVTAKLAALNEEATRHQADSSELLRLRGEVARLRAEQDDLRRRASAPPEGAVASAATTPDVIELPKDSWADAGFATPAKALQTRGWAVVTGNRERFKESVFVTPTARKTLEDMVVRMLETSPDPNKARFARQIVDNQLGVEDGILMPMMAENQRRGYTGYRILSQQSPAEDETVLQLEIQMASAPARKESLKLRRIGGDWKVLIDDDFIKSQR
jgi:hypothetical protein